MATVTTRIGLADNGRHMTLEEFRAADEEPGYSYELSRGRVEVTEVPNDPHGHVVWNLDRAIAEYHREHPQRIDRAGGGASFRLWLPGMISGRNPDFSVVLSGTPKDRRGRRPPSLVFEVVSQGGEARDYELKREEYLAFGLREYWIVDPIERRVTVLIRDGDVWMERVFPDGTVAEGLALPGFRMPVAELWVGIDEEEESEA
jgi:Uma2 family endonuclease